MTHQLFVGSEEPRTILGGSIVFPLRGVWVARIEVDANEENPLSSGAVRIVVASDDELEPVELFGTIRADDVRTWAGRAQAVVVGGLGLLGRVLLPAKAYQQAPFPTPLASIALDAISECGEQFDGDESRIPSNLLEVARWHRAGGRTAAQLLDRLASLYGLSYRVADDGRLLIGLEQWSSAALEDAGFFAIGPDDGIAKVLAGSIKRASVRPGTALHDGRRIEEITYELTLDGIQAKLRFGVGDGSGGVRGDYEAALRRALPSTTYLALHAATIRKRNADGTLDLEADNADISGVPSVPCLPGLPGCAIEPQEGDRVLLGFASGNEWAPYVAGFEQSASAMRGVARVADSVDVGSLRLIAAPDAGGGIASITMIYTPPRGSPAAVIVAPGSPVDIMLSGIIQTGSAEVKLRGD